MNEHEDRQVVTVPRWMMKECGGDPRDAMVLAQVAWWYQPPLDGARDHRSNRIVHRFDADWLCLVDADLAEQLGMTRSQVQRARAALVKRGLIESRTAKVDGERRTLVRPVIAGKRENAHRGDEGDGLCAETRDGSKREVARTRARATPTVEDQEEPMPSGDGGPVVTDLFGERPAAKSKDPNEEMAARIAKAVCEKKRPKPAGRNAYMGVRSVAIALLETDDHPARHIYDGMMAAGTITIRSVELEISKLYPSHREPTERRVEER